MSLRHGFTRTIGAALGLFAMLVVTLLAPVHQAHAANRDLARANGELLAAFVICHDDGLSADTPADADRHDIIAKCPICSLAKQVGAMPVPALVGVTAIWGAPPSPILSATVDPTSKPERTSQPRAPPILV